MAIHGTQNSHSELFCMDSKFLQFAQFPNSCGTVPGRCARFVDGRFLALVSSLCLLIPRSYYSHRTLETLHRACFCVLHFALGWCRRQFLAHCGKKSYLLLSYYQVITLLNFHNHSAFYTRGN